MQRRSTIAWAALLLARAGTGRAAEPEALGALRPAGFPNRPIEFVVAFPAGGGMDVTARIVARQAERLTGHRFVVNNRVGGAGVVAHSYLARQAPADGHTVGIVSSSLFVDGMLRSQGLWSRADLEIIGFINYDATNWIVASNGPLAGLDLRQVLARAREAPETVRISILPQSTSEFLAEQAEKRSGARFLKVPFQGGVPGMTAMLGGHVDIATVFYSEYHGQMAAGAVRPLAVANAGRLPNMPDVPTFNEVLGTDDILWAAWRFAVVPRAVVPEQRAYLAAVIRAAASTPEAVQEFTQAGVLLDPSLDGLEAVRAAADRLVAAQQAFFRESGRLR